MENRQFVKKLPNIITICRLLLLPVFVYLFFSVNVYVALVLFLLISFSDVLDGYIARKYDAVTDFGKLMDPLADKLTAVAAVVCLCIKGYIPLFAIVILVSKEVLMILGGAFLYNSHITVFSNWVGKLAAVLTNIAIFLSFFHKKIVPYDWYVLYFALGLQIVALIQYAYSYIFSGRSKIG